MSGTSPDPQHTCGFCPGCAACVVRRPVTRWRPQHDDDWLAWGRWDRKRSDPARLEWSHLDGTPLCLEETDDAARRTQPAWPVGTRVRPHAIAGRLVVLHGRTRTVVDYDEAEDEVHLLDADGTYAGRVWLGGHATDALAEELGLIESYEVPTAPADGDQYTAGPADAVQPDPAPVTVVVITSAPGQAPSGDVTGLRTALQFAAAMAAACLTAAPAAEQFVASLQQHGCNGTSGDAVNAAIAAAAALQAAAAAWMACHQALTKQEQVAEAYAVVPGAGSREFLTQT